MTQAGMARDNSILSLTGASQQALALNGSRQFLTIENTGNATVGVNICGGTAVIGGAGTLTLVANGSMTFPLWIPQNQINVIGTAGQPIVVIEG